MITFDLFADSDRHAAVLLNKALSRTKENNNLISPNRICETVTASGINAQKEIKQVLEAFNILYGFDKDKLIPGVILDTRITNPTVIPSITKKQVLDACQNVNSYKLHDHRMQVSFTKALSTTDRNPDETVHLFLDDVGTPRQRDTRKSANHDAVPRATKTVQTTNGAVMSKEGIYDSPTKSLFRPPDFNFKYLFRKNDHQRRTFGICDNSERFFFNFIETFVYFIFQLFPR